MPAPSWTVERKPLPTAVRRRLVLLFERYGVPVCADLFDALAAVPAIYREVQREQTRIREARTALEQLEQALRALSSMERMPSLARDALVRAAQADGSRLEYLLPPGSALGADTVARALRSLAPSRGRPADHAMREAVARAVMAFADHGLANHITKTRGGFFETACRILIEHALDGRMPPADLAEQIHNTLRKQLA